MPAMWVKPRDTYRPEFSVLDSTETEYQLKLKEGLYIAWENPSLNVQVKCERFSLAI